jgi:hypothetical protein
VWRRRLFSEKARKPAVSPHFQGERNQTNSKDRDAEEAGGNAMCRALLVGLATVTGLLTWADSRVESAQPYRVEYRQERWAERIFDNSDRARQCEAEFRSKGFEVRLRQHGKHYHVEYRQPRWSLFQTVARAEEARRLADELRGQGFEVRIDPPLALGGAPNLPPGRRLTTQDYRKALQDRDVSVRRQVVEGLPHSGLPAQQIGELLHDAFKRDRDDEVRRAALVALCHIDTRNNQIIHTIGQVLEQDRDDELRLRAARALGASGADSADAVRSLTHAVERDRSAFVRRAAAQSLGRLGPRAKEAIRTLTTAAERDRDPLVRRAAADVLRQIHLP